MRLRAFVKRPLVQTAALLLATAAVAALWWVNFHRYAA